LQLAHYCGSMEVMARETWTDERLDDLNKKVDDGFRDMREEFRAGRGEAQAFRVEVKEEFRALRTELTQLTYGLIGTMLVGFLGTIAAIVTQT
jgi:hypothetical protein